MRNDSISLPSGYNESRDSDGYPTRERKWMTGIPCTVYDATRADQTLAAQEGYTADITIRIDHRIYTGQGYLKLESTGEMYDVKRSHRSGTSNDIELTGQIRKGGRG